MSFETKSFFPLVLSDVEVGRRFANQAHNSADNEVSRMRLDVLDIVEQENPVLARYFDVGARYYFDNYPRTMGMGKYFNLCNVLGYLVLKAAAIRNNSVLPKLEFEDIKKGIQKVGQLPEPSHRRVEQIVKKFLRMGSDERQAVDSAYNDTDEGVLIVNLGLEGVRKALVYTAKNEPALNGFLHWSFDPTSKYEFPLVDKTDILDFDSFEEGERRGILSILEIYSVFALKILHPQGS